MRKTQTWEEKVEDIRRHSAKVEFRVSEFRHQGFDLGGRGCQTLWVSGDEGYQHRGYRLAIFPRFALLVVNEVEV